MNKQAETFNDIAGLNFIGLIEDSYVIELDIQPWHHNVRGITHGGVICTMLDTAMTRAFLHLLPPEQRHGATLEMKINFLKSSTNGKLTAYGNLVNRTKRTAYVEGYIENEQKVLIAKASATVMLFAPSI